MAKPLDQLESAHEYSMFSKTLLSALGSFWEDYYLDPENTLKVLSGATSLVSHDYDRLVNLAMSAGIADLPTATPLEYDLILIPENSFHKVDDNHFILEYKGIKNLEYFVSSLFEPDVVLEKDVHFTIHQDEIHFYVDIFNDPDIFNNVYRSLNIYQKHIVLWATNIALHTEVVYDRFGRYLYKKEIDSDDYKALISGFLYFYVNTKSIGRLEAVINILFGAPFSKTHGEVVEYITTVYKDQTSHDFSGVDYYYKIVTNRNEYHCPSFFDLKVEVGSTLLNYEVLGKLNYVEDYVSNPDWYKDAPFPIELLQDLTALDGFEDEYRNQYVYHSGVTTYSDRAIHNVIDFHEWVNKFKDEELPKVHRFTPYNIEDAPGHFDDLNVYNGTYSHDNKIKYNTLRGFYPYLYKLTDSILKYNLVYFKTFIPVQNFQYLNQQKFMFLEAIRTGLPVYLYPIVEFVATSIEEDRYVTLHDSTLKTEIEASGWLDKYSDNRIKVISYSADIEHTGKHLHNQSEFYDRDILYNRVDQLFVSSHHMDDGHLDILVLDDQENILQDIAEPNAAKFFRRYTGWDHAGSINY